MIDRQSFKDWKADDISAYIPYREYLQVNVGGHHDLTD